MALKVIRGKINDLRNDNSSYFPVVTELKGTINIVIGGMQLAVSRCMKCSSRPYYNKTLADRHVVIGTGALWTGGKQLLPLALCTVGYVLVTRAIVPYSNP
jgi:hypothetical protein